MELIAVSVYFLHGKEFDAYAFVMHSNEKLGVIMPSSCMGTKEQRRLTSSIRRSLFGKGETLQRFRGHYSSSGRKESLWLEADFVPSTLKILKYETNSR